METLGAISLGMGVMLLIALGMLVALGGKFAFFKNNKFIKFISDLFVKIILLCGTIFIATILWSALNQPTPFEKCMEQASGQVDPEAVDAIAEYCAQQTG
jgi:hypothetical protein